jgi:hypothetical protein
MRVARILHDPICGCECEVCDSDEINGTYRAQSFTYSGITSLWHACVCPKPNGVEFHRQEYLLGDCSMYGVENMLPLCPIEKFGEGIMSWTRFEKVKIGTPAGCEEPRLKIQEVHKETTSSEFISYLKPNHQKFVKHNYVATWQDILCRLAMETLPKDAILSHLGFAENYSFQVQNETQSMHWQSSQVTTLVHICYRHNPLYIEGGDTVPVIKDAHFYISDDN